uniref:Uncharacterized protein n=1 Tax=Timema shepardi TaxID=629360 RepID=A0A7R9FV57_TIMSH|nr:unnamed protein product [Timema shepardi]
MRSRLGKQALRDNGVFPNYTVSRLECEREGRERGLAATLLARSSDGGVGVFSPVLPPRAPLREKPTMSFK